MKKRITKRSSFEDSLFLGHLYDNNNLSGKILRIFITSSDSDKTLSEGLKYLSLCSISHKNVPPNLYISSSNLSLSKVSTNILKLFSDILEFEDSIFGLYALDIIISAFSFVGTIYFICIGSTVDKKYSNISCGFSQVLCISRKILRIICPCAHISTKIFKSHKSDIDFSKANNHSTMIIFFGSIFIALNIGSVLKSYSGANIVLPSFSSDKCSENNSKFSASG
jgi:hypothetical protein